MLNEPYNKLADESHTEQIPTYYAIRIEQVAVIDHWQWLQNHPGVANQ